MANDEFGQHTIAKIFRWAASLFGFTGGGVPAWVKLGLLNLQTRLSDLGEIVSNYVRDNGSFLSRVLGGLRRFWSAGILPLLRWLREKFLELRRWLKQILGPIYRILNRLRKEWLHFYSKIIRPILDTISAIRFALQVLGKFGVEWAKALDEKLAQLEAIISENFRRVLGLINRLEDTIDRVITFDYLIQRLTLLRSLERDAPFWIRMWWTRQIAPLSERDRQRFAAAPEIKTPAEHADELRQLLLFNDGPLAGLVNEVAADITRDLRALRSG